MMEEELLEIEPRELKFTVELMKHSSCSVRLFNKSAHYVAFKVKTTSPKKYCVKPNTGIMEPKSTFVFEVTMQAPRVAPEMTSRDKFLVQSTVVNAGATEEEITSSMFAKDNNKYVEERKLRVILISPPDSPVPSPMERVHDQFPAYDASPLEISQRRENMRLQFKVNDDLVEPNLKNAEPKASAKALDLQSVTSVQQLRLFKDINDLKAKINEMETKLNEAEETISKLTEERRSITQDSDSLRQEMALLKSKKTVKRVQVGFPFLYVCMVAIICYFIGGSLHS